jgi:hypothetical protein
MQTLLLINRLNSLRNGIWNKLPLIWNLSDSILLGKETLLTQMILLVSLYTSTVVSCSMLPFFSYLVHRASHVLLTRRLRIITLWETHDSLNETLSLSETIYHMQIPYTLTGYTLDTLLLFLDRFETPLLLLRKTLLLLPQTSLLSVRSERIQITANILLLEIHQLSILVIISPTWALFSRRPFLVFELFSHLRASSG